MLLLSAGLEAKQACDTIKSLRDKAAPADLPIVVLGELNGSQQQRCREAGACCFLNKPIEAEALAHLIDSSLSASEKRAAERNA
jgi:DNA-binding response OmpR family regulator